jgi:hypothetical protein
MTTHRSTLVLSLAIVLTAINLLLFVFLISRVNTPVSSGEGSILSGSALELVDDRGQVRARFNIEQDGQVALRLLDENGVIRVKLGASTAGSGLVLL